MTRSALETVRIYIDEVWNGGRDELVLDLCADPVTRHDANSVTQLNHAEQRARIAHNFAGLAPRFENVIFAGDEEFVTLVWNVTGRDPSWKLCGIEIFRVVGGRISEVWNSPYVDGRWGQSKTLSGGDVAFPIMGADLAAGEVVAPVDARNIGRWIERLLGSASSVERDGLWEHRFAGAPADWALSLTLADTDAAAQHISAARVQRLGIEVARSGLINATIAIGGTVETGEPVSPRPGHKVVRLAETFGSLDGTGRVIDASIGFDAGGGDASGRVTIRMDAARQSRSGRLVIGWRHEDFALRFEMDADLGDPIGSFVDGDEVEASFAWRGKGVTALLVNDVPGAGK